MKAKEFDRVVEKLGFQTRDSGDRLAWLEHEGKIIIRTRRSHGSGDVPMADAIRQQLKLNEDQLRDAVDCTMTRAKYLDVLRSKGLVAEPPPPS